MPPTGGPAALNGFLYQILQHIGLLAEVRLTNSIAGQELCDGWSIVLEPISGGDAQLHMGEYVVEQYKTRSGTWSLTAIQDDVLRGLRRAIPVTTPGRAAYRFVTDGRPGRHVDRLFAFFDRARLVAHPDLLDDTETRSYDGEELTDTGLFRRICESSRSNDSGAGPHEEERVFHLLTHFDAEWEHTADALTKKIEERLALYFPGAHDIYQARLNLQGLLLDRLSNGELRLDADGVRDLFAKVNLDPDVPKKFAVLAETLAHLANERLTKVAGYVRSEDVRPALTWPSDRPVLVITGESGNGKTWRLARLVRELAARRQIVTWSRALESAKDQIDMITDDVWAAGLHQQGARTLAALELYYRQWTQKAGHWLTVAVDDVANVELARQLVQRDWSGDSVRLAMSATASVAISLRSRYPSLVHVVEVGEFGVMDLDNYLQVYGRRWSELPDDLKQLLKKPILAGLYVRLPYSSFKRAPRSEYEVFDGFWNQMKSRASPGDAGILLEMAARVLRKESYPVERSSWASVGADTGSAERLIAVGWLRLSDSDELMFAHDRLLNWAVAVSLAKRAGKRAIGETELAELLLVCLNDSRAFSRPLGYVLMDALWLLASSGPSDFDLQAVLARLEEYGHASGSLYEDMLPTMGRFALEMILGRLEMVVSIGDARSVYLRHGLEAIARQEGIELHGAVQRLLESDVADLQRVGLELIRIQPAADYLERLWAMREWHSRDHRESFRDPTLWCDAVRACVPFNLDWFVELANSGSASDENMADLAYVLAGLESPRAHYVWERVRNALITCVPRARSRGVLYCISRFCDGRYVAYCKDRLSEEADFLNTAALPALARLSPKDAISSLDEVAENTRYFTVSNWLTNLLELEPDAVRARLLELAKRSGEVEHALGLLFQSAPDSMGDELFAAFLDDLEARMALRDATSLEPSDDWLYRPLDVLSRISNFELLRQLRERRGGALERLITAAAMRRTRRPSMSQDHILESARLTLLRIAGNGIGELLAAELGSTEYWGRHGGLMWAELGGLQMKGLLYAIASKPRQDEDTRSNGRMEPYLAVTKLAAIGADRELVDSIWRVESDCISTELANLRGEQVMNAELLEPALAALQTYSVDDPELWRALAIAWLSGEKVFLKPIRELLAHLEPTSTAAAIAFHALWRLEDRSDEAFEFAKRLLASEKGRWMAINLLIAFRERGHPLLRAHLESRSHLNWDHLDKAIIGALHEHPSTRAAAIEAAKRDLSRGHSSIDTPSFRIAAESEAVPVREQILEAAFTYDRTVVGRAVEAIQAISTFDVARALEAAGVELVATAKTADGVCRLVVELAGPDAANWLAGIGGRLEKDRREAIGRAMRRLPGDRVTNALEVLLRSELRTERLLGLELASWTKFPDSMRIHDLAHSDPEGKVRDAATTTLRFRRGLKNGTALLCGIPGQPESVQWSLLHAVIWSIHPSLLSDREDELWLGSALDQLPPRFTQFAKEQIKRSRDKTV
jgi:hypothetical protein